MNRRGLLIGAGAGIVAPAIVTFANLMRVKVMTAFEPLAPLVTLPSLDLSTGRLYFDLFKQEYLWFDRGSQRWESWHKRNGTPIPHALRQWVGITAPSKDDWHFSFEGAMQVWDLLQDS